VGVVPFRRHRRPPVFPALAMDEEGTAPSPSLAGDSDDLEESWAGENVAFDSSPGSTSKALNQEHFPTLALS